MRLSRRDLLKLGFAAVGPSLIGVPRVVSQAFAAPGASDTKFLLVFLRGGYDAANVVIPIASDLYYEARPTIAVPRPDPSNPQAALPLTGTNDESATWGIHPALKDTMLPLWHKGQLAFIPFAGTDDLTRSHFETQDSIEVGMPVTAAGMSSHEYGSGFLNRLAAVLDGAGTPVSFTDGLPVVMTGDVVVPNVSLKNTGRAPFEDRQTQLLLDMYKDTRFEPLIVDGFDLRKTVAEQADMIAAGTANEMQAANRRAITATGFELEARRMAGLMKDKFNIAFIDVGGWDTHVNQGNAQGQLANLLTSLGQGLAAFVDQLGAVWSRTVVVVISEFGRTFRENGTRGTDHGHGSVYWVLGGALQGGRMVGEQISISQQTLNQNRDFPVLTEYRALLGGIFKRMYSLDTGRIQRVFPNATPRDLNLV